MVIFHGYVSLPEGIPLVDIIYRYNIHNIDDYLCIIDVIYVS